MSVYIKIYIYQTNWDWLSLVRTLLCPYQVQSHLILHHTTSLKYWQYTVSWRVEKWKSEKPSKVWAQWHIDIAAIGLTK